MKRFTLQKQLKSALGVALLATGWSSTPYAQTQLGGDIDGEAAGDESGHSVSLDGNRVAISTPKNDGGTTRDAGHVRVYEWNGSAWTQMGDDIDGEAQDDESGHSVSLSGNRVAIGAYLNGNGNNVQAGHVRVYEWNGSAWTQMGADIDGETGGNRSGYSVSLEGSRLAIGAIINNGNSGNFSGHVRVYEWSGTAWTQLGADIDGEATNDQSGWSVSLNGDRVAIGTPYNNGNGKGAGHVRVYEWNGSAWTQMGADIDGEAAGDESGWSVSLDGNRVAIGAHSPQ